MKKLRIVAIVLLVLMPLILTARSEKKTEQKKFRVTVTVVYNEITLKEASELEAKSRSIYHDACSVDIETEGERET